jgi:hypothetical protein
MTTGMLPPGRGFGCAGGMTVNRLESRLHQLEAQLQAAEPTYTAAVEVAWAQARVGARTRRRIAEALGAGACPADPADRELLAGDSPAQAAADLELLERWARAHPELARGTEGARERIAARLEQQAQRLETTPCTRTSDG